MLTLRLLFKKKNKLPLKLFTWLKGSVGRQHAFYLLFTSKKEKKPNLSAQGESCLHNRRECVWCDVESKSNNGCSVRRHIHTTHWLWPRLSVCCHSGRELSQVLVDAVHWRAAWAKWVVFQSRGHLGAFRGGGQRKWAKIIIKKKILTKKYINRIERLYYYYNQIPSNFCFIIVVIEYNLKW